MRMWVEYLIIYIREKIELNNSLKQYDTVIEEFTKQKESISKIEDEERTVGWEIVGYEIKINEIKKTIQLYENEIKQKKEFYKLETERLKR